MVLNVISSCKTQGEVLSFLLTPGNSSDIQIVETLSKGTWGQLFGDKGYISSNLAKKRFIKGIQRFTGIHSNMKQKLMHLQDKILLKKRTLIETVNDPLKNISQIEHSRHRSPFNFMIHLSSTLAAYILSAKKAFKYSQLSFSLVLSRIKPKTQVSKKLNSIETDISLKDSLIT